MKKWTAAGIVLLGAGLLGMMLTFDLGELEAFGTQPVSSGTQNFSAQNIHRIHADSDHVDLKIVEGAGEDITVRLEGRASSNNIKRYSFEAGQEGDALVINGYYRDGFSIGFNTADVDLIVELPAKHWEEVKLVTDTGKIEADALDSGTIVLQTEHGNILGEHHQGGTLAYESVSGNLTLSGLSGNDIRLKSSLGNIKSDELKSGTIAYETNSGNIEVKQLQADTTELLSDHGRIHMDGFESGTTRFKSLTGNVKLSNGTGEVSGTSSDGNIGIYKESADAPVHVQSSTGNIELIFSKQPESAAVELVSGTGNTKNGWEGYALLKETEGEWAGTYGAGTVAVHAESSAGNVTLGKD